MNISLRHLGWSSLALFALVGCDSSTPPAPPTAPTPAPGGSEPGKNEIKSLPVDKADTGKLTDEEVAEIKKLPAEDQPVAMAQMVCPVSDKHLGSMDVPIKKTADGKTAFLCCAGCVDSFEKDPATYLAKLKK